MDSIRITNGNTNATNIPISELGNSRITNVYANLRKTNVRITHWCHSGAEQLIAAAIIRSIEPLISRRINGIR